MIIKVPSTYMIKLPRGEWVNLALVRRLEIETHPPLVVRVEWSDGTSQTFYDSKALALVEACEETMVVDKSEVQYV